MKKNHNLYIWNVPETTLEITKLYDQNIKVGKKHINIKKHTIVLLMEEILHHRDV